MWAPQKQLLLLGHTSLIFFICCTGWFWKLDISAPRQLVCLPGSDELSEISSTFSSVQPLSSPLTFFFLFCLLAWLPGLAEATYWLGLCWSLGAYIWLRGAVTVQGHFWPSFSQGLATLMLCLITPELVQPWASHSLQTGTWTAVNATF